MIFVMSVCVSLFLGVWGRCVRLVVLNSMILLLLWLNVSGLRLLMSSGMFLCLCFLLLCMLRLLFLVVKLM